MKRSAKSCIHMLVNACVRLVDLRKLLIVRILIDLQVSSPSFRKNVGLFQYAMDYIGIDSAFVCVLFWIIIQSIYSIDNSDLPGDDTIEMGSKSYIKRIEMWAKEELEKEKQEKEKNNCFVCFTFQYSY